MIAATGQGKTGAEGLCYISEIVFRPILNFLNPTIFLPLKAVLCFWRVFEPTPLISSPLRFFAHWMGLKVKKLDTANFGIFKAHHCYRLRTEFKHYLVPIVSYTNKKLLSQMYYDKKKQYFCLFNFIGRTLYIPSSRESGQTPADQPLFYNPLGLFVRYVTLNLRFFDSSPPLPIVSLLWRWSLCFNT